MMRKILLPLLLALTGQVTFAQSAEQVPAQIAGLWCGTGPLWEFSLDLKQHGEEVEGTLTRHDRVRDVYGHMQGDTLISPQTRHGGLEARLTGNELLITGGNGLLSLLRGSVFKLAQSGRCGQ